MPRRECIDCGTLTAGSRCPECTRAKDRARGTTTQRGLGWEHQQAARALLADATVCAICHLPPTADDPLTAGHLIPRDFGGTSEADNYQPEHRSCNVRKGNRLWW